MGTKLDVAFKFGAGRYIQEPDALKLAGGEIGRFGHHALVIGGPTALDIAGEPLRRSLSLMNLWFTPVTIPERRQTIMPHIVKKTALM